MPGRHPERAGIGLHATGAGRLVEAGQATGRSRWLHGEVTCDGVDHQARSVHSFKAL